MLRDSGNQRQKRCFSCALLFLCGGIVYSANVIYLLLASQVGPDFLPVLIVINTVIVASLNYAFILMANDDLQQDIDWALARLRQESDQRLHELQQRWLLALDYARLGAWEVDLESDTAVMSPHWTRMLGMPEQELRITTGELMLYMHPDDVATFRRCMLSLQSGKAVMLEHEHRLRRNNGSWMWVCSRARLIANLAQPGATLLIGIDIDISDSRLRQGELEQAIAAAEQAKAVALQASKAKTTFLSNISHEIRTPMNAILGFSQVLLADRNLAPRHQESLDIINSSGVHLLSLIDDILNLSRLQSGNFTIRRDNVDAHELFAEIADYFRTRTVCDGVTFISDIDCRLPRWLLLDTRAVRQLCRNLLANAFKFTAAGRVVFHVRWEAELDAQHGLLRLEVSDTGVGIKPENLSLIFNVFESNSSTEFTTSGLGLGLAICKDIVNQLDGRFEVESLPGEGSRFCVRLPVDVMQGRRDQTAPTAPQQKLAAVVPLLATPHRILVVDDIESNRKLLLRILGEQRHVIREATNATDALNIIREWRPSLVLMDIRMPLLSGDEAIIEIRKDPSLAQLPVIAITANAFDGERERLLALGATDFISKPFLRSDIIALVSELLGPAPMPETARQSSMAANDDGSRVSRKVLVVDDNVANQQLLVAQLEALGLQAEAACNGREGYTRWCEQRHDIVLTDCAMPLVDGYALARLIRQTESDTSKMRPTLIIAVTGAPEENSERCLESGMNDIISKPILLSKLSKILKRHQVVLIPRP